MFSLDGVIFISGPFEAAVARENLLVELDMESSSLDGAYFEGCCGHSSSFVSSPVRAGSFAHRSELRKSDPNVESSKRTEYSFFHEKVGNLGDTRWFGFSYYVPSDWVDDNSGQSESVWQMHPKMDDCSTNRNPIGALLISEDYYQYVIRTDSKRCSTPTRQTTKSFNLGKIKKGQWNDFVIHTKWSYGPDGFTKIWLNGKVVLDYKGPNHFNIERKYPFAKFGLYKWGWAENPNASKVSKRVIYQDEIRIGDENATYADVAPGDSAARTRADANSN